MAGGERRRRRLRRGGRSRPAEPGSGPAGVDRAQADPATVDPATADPATVDPATADPADVVDRPSTHGAGHHRPSPADLAELAGSFALTAGVHDPESVEPHHDQRYDEAATERGLRGLVGGGSSQVSVPAAMRARDASRPDEQHVAAAEADLTIVRRGWVPREDLPRPGRH